MWPVAVLLLAKIAESQPHAAFSAFTHGLSSRWHFVFHTVTDIVDFLQPLEDMIHYTLFPVLLGISPPNDILCNLIALPPHWGGLEILNPTTLSAQEYSAPLTITKPLSHHIGSGQCVGYFQVKSEQLSRKSEIRLSKQSMYSNTSASLRVKLNHASQVSLDLATTRGASAWLSALSLYIRSLFMMPLPYIMVGPCIQLLLTVPVKLSSQWIMLYPPLRVVFLPFIIMKSGALQLVS